MTADAKRIGNIDTTRVRIDKFVAGCVMRCDGYFPVFDGESVSVMESVNVRNRIMQHAGQREPYFDMSEYARILYVLQDTCILISRKVLMEPRIHEQLDTVV